MDIRLEIANKRAERIKSEGYGLSTKIPKERVASLNNFNKGPFVICEVKRGSPSKGHFAKGLNAVEQAGIYYSSGVKHISVLTEEDRFYGSLKDLMDIKKNYPDVAVLRKDFLLDIDDIETSYLCGADAYLLIASILDKDLLYKMYKRGVDLGMTPLVEVHDKNDVDKVRELKPKLVGINSRDLKTFNIDPLRPLKIKSYIDWDCNVVYESGIKIPQDGEFARDAGFSGVLVGEWAVKNRGFSKELISIFSENKGYSPWKELFKRYSSSKPFIKICGLTNREDFDLACELGANITGFILAESPRRVSTQFIESLPRVNGVLKAGVVVLKGDDVLDPKIVKLIKDGHLDFIQFHGDESYEKCLSYDVPFYKALRIKDDESIKQISQFGVVSLIDSFSENSYGGTGKIIDNSLTEKARQYPNLWLAGGLNPENVALIIEKFKPELVDVSSGLEETTGKKSLEKMKQFFKEIENGKI